MEIQVQFTFVWLLSLLMEQKRTGRSCSIAQEPGTSISGGKVFSCCLLTDAVPGEALGGDAYTEEEKTIGDTEARKTSSQPYLGTPTWAISYYRFSSFLDCIFRVCSLPKVLV